MNHLITVLGLILSCSDVASAANGPAVSSMLRESRQRQEARATACAAVLSRTQCSSAQAAIYCVAIDSLKATCSKNLEASGCLDLAKELGPEVAAKKVRRCDDAAVCSDGLNWQEMRNSCGAGLQEFGKEASDAVVAAWKSMQASYADARACDIDLERKRKLYDDFNKTVPKILSVKRPEGRYFEQATCYELQRQIDGAYRGREKQYLEKWQAARTANPKLVSKPELLSAELREFQYWLDVNDAKRQKETQEKIAALKAAWSGIPDYLNSLGVKLSCYNSATQVEIACQAGAALAAMALGGGAAAAGGKFALKLAEASGSLKVMRAVKAIEKNRDTGAAAPLKLVGSMTDTERRKLIKALGVVDKIKDPKKREGAIDAIINAHHICDGQGFGPKLKYSAQCLRQKALALKKAGFEQPERELLMRNGIAGNYRGPGDWLIFEDGRLPNPKLALSADQIMDNTLKSIAGFEAKRAEQAFKIDDLAGLVKTHKDLGRQIYAKSGGRPVFESSELVTSHESVVLRAYGRDMDSVAEDVLKEARRRVKEVPDYKGKSVGDMVDIESANLKKQADQLLAQAAKDDNVVDYYRAKMLLETRKKVLLEADDAGISVHIDWEAAHEDLELFNKKFINGDSNRRKWVEELEKIERALAL
ncbi:MAG: hypothetical protein IPJ84_21290 [Bdellovibrionales bacterium]|nr:hypothetical protein [Bdellovibrionales bacterium]